VSTAPARRALKSACAQLAKADPALAHAYEVTGVPVWRYQAPSYAMLARMITHQQISLSAAAAIWNRFEALLGEVTVEAILAAGPGAIRQCGMSGRKVAYLISIAEAMGSGRLDLARVCAARLDEARAELLTVRGIGPWTGELVLLYGLGELDAFPTGDVGLREAHRRLVGYAIRMDSKAFTRCGERWRPYRGVAAHLLWAWLHINRTQNSTRAAA
jgi:DNA-3-methyladenine glycosylase II